MNIPQELIDKIIDGVWDADDSPSHTATKAASLISTAWVERSQHHLFHDIQFSTSGSYFRHWCGAVSPGPNGVSRHVRSLTIRARGSDGRWIGKETFERGLPFLDSFRNVQVLRICYWDIEPFPPEMLTRYFASLGGSVRVLQWDPYVRITRESWTRIVGLFPLVDCLLHYPSFFPTGLLSDIPAGPTRKKLVLSGGCVAPCLVWGGGSLRFREIYVRCDSSTALLTIIAIVNGNADRLEILSIAGIRKVIDVDTPIPPSFLSGCHALRELSIDWFPFPASVTSELHLIDAIPGGSIQSLRVMPDRALWRKMWNGRFSHVKPSRLITPYEKLAEAIVRLGMRNPGRKISVWFVVPRVPYVICDPVRECVVALWERVEEVVSFQFQMTEVESQNIDERHPITGLA